MLTLQFDGIFFTMVLKIDQIQNHKPKIWWIKCNCECKKIGKKREMFCLPTTSFTKRVVFYISFFGLGACKMGCFFCYLRTWIDAKIELFPLIKPHFCQPGIVMVDNLWSAPRKSIRGRFSENMPNVWASGNHQFTTAHPDLQGKTITELELATVFGVNKNYVHKKKNLG